MNEKVAKAIRRFAIQRGGNAGAFDSDLLKKIYEKADKSKKAQFRKEMRDYDKAIQSGIIEKGQSILHSIYSHPTHGRNK